MENKNTQNKKPSQRGSNYVKLIIPKSAIADIQAVFRNAKFFPLRAEDEKTVVSIPRDESDTLQQFLTEMKVSVELQNYKSPYLQYFVSKDYEKTISEAFGDVKQWPSREDTKRNVVSVHYRLNPQLWQFCKEKGIKLERIKR